MRIHVGGQVENTSLKPYRALQPLFEAVSNSVHAIQDSSRQGRGSIRIELARDESSPTTAPGTAPIVAIRIIDNGIGFTTENFEAFEEAGTRFKEGRGGKGFGRFFWIKVFDHATVDSTYIEGGRWYRRLFSFRRTRDGIEGDPTARELTANEHRTVVELVQPRPPYADHFPHAVKTIASRIAEHFLPTLFFRDCPRITIADEEETVDINALFEETFTTSSEEVDFTANGHNLKIRHIRNPGTADPPGHQVHFCADHRRVEGLSIDKLDPVLDLPKILVPETNEHFYYVGVVTGEALDRAVNIDRGTLELPEEPSLTGLSRSQLRSATATEVRAYLHEFLRPLRERQIRSIEALAIKEPQYKVLLKRHREALETIPLGATSERVLDEHLRRIQFDIHAEIRARGEEIKRKKIETIDDIERYHTLYERYIQDIDELGQASLAQYVAHRFVVLELLGDFLKIDDQGKHQLESLIHTIICPMRITSSDFEFRHHNLWLVDERLEYHGFLASDKELRSVMNTRSSKRPDVLIFDRPLAFSQVPSSVVLLEFKRPRRNDYTQRSNPIADMISLVGKVRAHKLEVGGRRVLLPDDIPFFVFIIADIESTLKDIAESQYDFDKLPRNGGYIKYHRHARALFQVISWDRLLQDACGRNRILFDRLNLVSS